MTDDIDVEARLAALGAATQPVGPRPDFGSRVMAAVEGEPAAWLDHVAALSSRLLPLAAALAIVAVGWAVRMDHVADDAVAASYDDVVEAPW